PPARPRYGQVVGLAVFQCGSLHGLSLGGSLRRALVALQDPAGWSCQMPGGPDACSRHPGKPDGRQLVAYTSSDREVIGRPCKSPGAVPAPNPTTGVPP